MASAAVETLVSFPIASRPRSLLRPFPRRPAAAAAAGGCAPSIRISAVPPRGLGLALVHRRARRCPPAARANVEHGGDGASGNGEPSSSSGDGDRDAAADSGGDTTGTSTTSAAQTPPPPSSKRGENKWRRRLTKGGGVGRWLWEPIVQGREMGFLLLQLGFAVFALRMLRPEIALPGSEPRPQTTYVSVPYSDFLASIDKDQVKKVEVDGVHVMFRLRPEVESQVRVEQTPSQRGTDAVVDNAGVSRRIVFTTTRPVDIKTPYEKMVENMVEFGSPDKRSGGTLNSALVALIYVVLIAVVLQRLPISFSQHSAGQLRNRKNSNSGRAKVSESTDIVTFADVAGVDEAKEELEEIVEFLRNPERYVRLGARPPRGVLLVGFANAISNGNYCLTIVFVTILLFFIYRWVFQGLERHFLQKP
ncbi:ATP-dependent zinc metalloprotease FTSH 7 chloroplastic [Zea mays]|uniref:ATP-dependent zinc metalloprotease FTSH 7 chloroplastic n=1 Tax=Zea mays TaxID=4577 RepID=A0A1D6Q686_MAIZE|nr:ATP-dependent zinc metalloprotease FTSH 7 chloroplastic [Zea mays]